MSALHNASVFRGVKLDLPILDGTYDAESDSWSLSDNAVHYATATVAPNDNAGSTFLYGHNTAPVLEITADIQVGDIAKVHTNNGLVFQYIFTSSESVTPDRTDVLNDRPLSPRLTLMTCEGWWSETRRLMYFEFAGVST